MEINIGDKLTLERCPIYASSGPSQAKLVETTVTEITESGLIRLSHSGRFWKFDGCEFLKSFSTKPMKYRIL